MAFPTRRNEPEMTSAPTMSTAARRSDGFGHKILLTLTGVLLVYVIFYVGALMRNTMKKYNYIGMMDQVERTINVGGYGKVTGQNDIATLSIGHSTTDRDVAKAQQANKKVMDAVMKDLRDFGIGDDDLQTSYSIYPDYSYSPERGQELRGYRVSHSVTVKIRDLSKITNVLALPGKYGATEVGGLSFTVDDPNQLKDQARAKALLDAKTRAAKLAASLGVVLGEVVSYSDYEAQGDYPYPVMMKAEGMGGGGIGAPSDVSAGSREYAVNANITFKIYPVSRW